MTLYLHIGLHKTGTSSLQVFLKRNRERLANLGYAYPEAGWIAGAHHNVAYELLGKKRFDPEAGGASAALAQAAEAKHAVLSSEEFEFMELAQVRRLRALIGGMETKVIVYLRRQDALIASTYAQQIKMGAKVAPFAEYVTGCLYNPRFDFPQLLARWAQSFGRENLSVAVVCPETAGDRLFRDFLTRAGLGQKVERFTKPAKALNQSPVWSAVELIRHVTARVRGRDRMEPAEMKAIQAAATRLVEEEPALASGQVALNPEQYGRVAARYGPGNLKVAADYVASPAQAAALVYEPTQAVQTEPPDEARIEAAAENLAAMLSQPTGEAGE